MANNKDNNTSQALQSLREKMGQKRFRGSYARTAKKLDCTPNWVWKVMNEKTVSSIDVVERVIKACLAVLEEMTAEEKKSKAKESSIASMVDQRLQAITA